MKPVRYIVGAIGFLLVWGFIAALTKIFVIHFISPGHGAFTMPGGGWTWRDLPGNVLGLIAGVQSFRVSVREPREPNRWNRMFTWMLGLGVILLFVFVACFLYQTL